MIKITQNFYQAKAKVAVHRLLSVFAIRLIVMLWLFCGISQVNAQTTLFSTDFSSSDWSGITNICNTSNQSTFDVYNGIHFYSKSSTAKPFVVNNGTGTMTWCNNNVTSGNYFIAIPVTGVNGSITVTVANGSTGNRVSYSAVVGTTPATTTGSFTASPSPADAPEVVTINGLTNSSYIVYLGRQGSGFTNVTSIAITTPSPAIPTIVLSSAVGTNAQTVSANSAITNIAYTLGGTATAAGANIAWGGGNAPAGVIFNKSANPVTISGTPTVQGTYNYTVTTDGSPAATATGSITVNPADVTPPALQSSTPANAATGVSLSGNITLAFDENVTLADASKIALTGGVGSLTTSGVANGTTLTIPYTGLAGATAYTLTIDSGAIRDMSGNAYAGTTLVFTTLTPAPVITLTSAAATTNQSLKSGQAIASITYTFANANATTPYILTGTLPTGVTANYASGILTISGTATAVVYPTTSNYTITAVPLAGYAGSSVTASGSIVVRDPNAKNVAFLYTGTLPAGANKLYDMLNANYTVTAIQSTGNGTATDFDAAYTGHDLIVLHESVGSGNLAALKLGTKIGTVPVLNTKVHMYGKANWPTGTGANGAAGDTFIKVNSTFQAHPIFGGVTMTGGQVTMANTNGIIRYATGVTASSNIAYSKSDTDETKISVLEVNNQTVADAHKYMLIPFAAANEDLNANGLLLFKNACDYLMLSNVYFPTTIWNGSAWTGGTPNSTLEVVIDGSYSTTTHGVFAAKKLTVAATGSLTINSGTNVTVQNEVINNGTLIVENNANLIQVNNTVNTGTVTVKRNSNALFRSDYTLWSSPVSGQNLFSFSPLTVTTPISRFSTYNSATNSYNSIVDPSAISFSGGTGYLIRMPNEDVTPNYNTGGVAIEYPGVFTGVLNNGNVGFTGLVSNSYHAIGNPYPSTVSAAAFLTGNPLANGTLYFWRKTNNPANSSYATWTTSGGVANTGGSSSIIPNGTIQVGQGFIANTGTGTSLSFTNAMRETTPTSTQFLRTKKASEIDRVWLNVTNASGLFSQSLVAYVDGASVGVDRGDGKYINDSAIALTFNIDNEEYIIQGRPAFDASDVVPLSFKSSAEGQYTIAIDHAEGVFAADQDVYLVDAATGAETNLKSGSYTFTAPAETSKTRFSLRYQKTLGVNDAAFNENNVGVYTNKGVVYVNSNAVAIANVKVYDIQGRLLAELKDVKSTSATIATLKATNQVLVVKVTAEDNTVVTKKVVN